MNNRVLVAYASKCGSTGEVAEAIGQALSEGGVQVDVRPVGEVKDVSAYGAVVVGSAIRGGHWLKEAMEFVKSHQPALSQRPTAYFLVSLFLSNDSPETRDKVAAYLDPVRAIHEPVITGMFAGKMDFSRLSFAERMISKLVKAPEGDYRDWQAVRAWAEQLPAALLST